MEPERREEILGSFANACASGDLSLINHTWSRFYYDLVGAKGVFVVNDSKYEKPLLPLDAIFKSKCFLKGWLKSRRLGLIQNSGSSTPFTYGGYILADTNFVSYCNCVFLGKDLGDNTEAFHAVSNYLMPNRAGLVAICYMVENFHQRTLPQVRESIKAFAAFKFADPEAFSKTGKIVPTISESRLQEIINSVLADMESQDFKTLYERMRQNYLVGKIALTQMAVIEFGSNKQRTLQGKLLELLKFFDKEVSMLPQLELIVACKYFELRNNEPFFKKIQRNSKELLFSINSMAWDIAHWRNAMDLMLVTSVTGNGPYFPIPYFLTFDAGFAALLGQIQLNGVIFHGQNRLYEAIHDLNLFQTLSCVFEGEGEQIISPDAISKRKSRLAAIDNHTTHLEHLVQTCIQKLNTVLPSA